MKTRTALAALTLALTSCSQQVYEPLASMSGTHDLVTLGDLLFITSTDRSELRVLNLIPPPRNDAVVQQKLSFVPAPNILQPLSVPVVDRPTSLARDVRFDAQGKQVEGPYVYAMSEGSPEVSVVGPSSANAADAFRLVELRRLREGAPVTAIAAVGGATATDTSTLFLATYDGTQSDIRRRSLPGVDSLVGATEATVASGSILTLPNEAVVALLPLPGATKLVVATRSDGGRAGRTLELDIASGVTRPYNFPAPVRVLATNPSSALGATAAGRYVYGVLDEAACRDRPRPSAHPAAIDPPCRGILAVESSTGVIANQRVAAAQAQPDGTVTTVIREFGPMKPIAFGNAVITSVTIAADAVANAPTGAGPVNYPLLGLFTVATGQVTAFNAQYLHVFDSALDATASFSAVTFRKANGTAVERPVAGMVVQTNEAGAILSPTAAEGAAVNEIVFATFQGAIPGFSSVAVTLSSANAIPLGAGAAVDRLRLEDHVVFSNMDGSCAAEVTINAIAPTQLTTAEAIPSSCLGTSVRYSVVAAGGVTGTDTVHAPWVVNGETSGYMGRAANNAAFVPEVTRYFTNTADYNVATPAPQLRFEMGPGDASFARGDRYELTSVAGFTPYFFGFSVSSDPTFAAGLNVPTAITYQSGVYHNGQRVPDAEVGTRGTAQYRAFIAYPASMGLMEVNLPGIVPLAANTQNFMPYR
ncbi:MAG: hypothetical protein ACT4TC_23300 [Myxococcaceae bacterium]